VEAKLHHYPNIAERRALAEITESANRWRKFMPRLRMLQFCMVTVVLCTGLLVVPRLVAGSLQTFTGKISDKMCGAQHTEGLDPVPCVRACAKRNVKYVLVVGNKIYTLDTSDQATMDKFDKFAGEDAQVTGTVNGDVISVKSVTAAK
jgi:hypothetical protein